MLVSLTVGKVDAGVAVLLTDDKRLIEFPSILLPPDIHSGSIVDINVSRNHHAELVAEQKFTALQDDIYSTFGSESPSAPALRCRNATQTSIVLEWEPIHLAAAELRSLSLYRNGTKAGIIPRDKLSTKISGLALDTEYTFHLVLRTSAGQYASEKLTVRTHKMTDLGGITITPGIMPAQLRDSLSETVHRIGAKMIDSVRIDTTHFVCTEPRGQAWEKALEMNVPVVVPDWVKGCETEGRIVGVRGYYLDADPKLRQMSVSQVTSSQQRPSVNSNVSMRDSPRIEHTPPTPERPTREQGRNNVTSAPPPAMEQAPAPPPKPASPQPAQLSEAVKPDTSSTDGGSIGGTTMVEQRSGHEDDDSDAESDNTEKAMAMGREQAEEHSGSEDETTQEEAVRVADEDGKFDEVDF